MEGEPVENITFNVDTENTLGDIPVTDVISLEKSIIFPTEDTLGDIPQADDTLGDIPQADDTLGDIPQADDTLGDIPQADDTINFFPPTYNDLKPVDPNLFITPLINNPNIIEKAYINQPYVKELELNQRLHDDNTPYDSLVKDLVDNYLIIENSQNEIDDVINMIRNFKIPKNNLKGMSIIDNYNKKLTNNNISQKNILPINNGNRNPPIFSNNITRKNPQMKMFFP